MVQWLANPATHASRGTLRDGVLAPNKRPARRGYSVTDAPPDFFAAAAALSAAPPSSSSAHIPTEASIPENAVLRSGPPLAASSHRAPQTKKPPRRSYSATDKEPEDTTITAAAAADHQRHPLLSGGGLLSLPPELHYTLFDLLDPIDAVCLGLAHPALYAVHRRLTAAARVPLSSRYSGPNDLEWVWRGVRHLSGQRGSTTTTTTTNPRPLDGLRVKGQVYCRKCGISRCELHRHIQGWMGPGYQYCEIRERFGPPAPADAAKAYCFMSSPKDRHRCGRHGALKGSSSLPAPPPPWGE